MKAHWVLFFIISIVACQQGAGLSVVKNMWQGTIDDFKKPLPSMEVISASLTGDEITDLKYLLQTVQGSMPVYAPGTTYESPSDVLEHPKGDCGQLTHRFVIVVRKLGYQAVGRAVLNFYIPGHVFADVSINNHRYFVDINHGVIVDVQTLAIYYTPHKIPYYLPANVFTDWWGDTASLDLWIKEIRDERWPAWLATGNAINEIDNAILLEYKE